MSFWVSPVTKRNKVGSISGDNEKIEEVFSLTEETNDCINLSLTNFWFSPVTKINKVEDTLYGLMELKEPELLNLVDWSGKLQNLKSIDMLGVLFMRLNEVCDMFSSRSYLLFISDYEKKNIYIP